MSDKLKFIIGENTWNGGFTIMHGDKDVSEIFDVTRFELVIDTNAPDYPSLTTVRLDVTAAVEIESSAVIVKTSNAPGDVKEPAAQQGDFFYD